MKNKILSKCLLFGVTYFLLITSANAQDKGIFMSVAPEIGVTTGIMGDYFSLGIGGSLRFEKHLSSRWRVGIASGYTNIFPTKNLLSYEGLPQGAKLISAKFIPLKLSGNYFFGPKFYASGELGSSLRIDGNTVAFFAYSPGVGYLFGDKFDLGFRFEGRVHQEYIDINQFVLRLAYRFRL